MSDQIPHQDSGIRMKRDFTGRAASYHSNTLEREEKAAAEAAEKETQEYMAYLQLATQRTLLQEGESTSQDVTTFYLPESKFAQLASWSKFDTFTLSIIVVNALWIGIDTEINSAPEITKAAVFVIWVENFFCFYFTFEVLVRFVSFEYACNCIRDFWFRFDGILVCFMVLETWIMPFFAGGNSGVGALATLRLLRLARLTRMVRIMRSVPELLTLIKGMVRATKSVASTLALLVIFLYVFGLVFAMQYKDYIGTDGCQGCEVFKNIEESMFVLFIAGTLLDDLTQYTDSIRNSNLPAMLIPWYVFVLLSSFTVLNMLIGVLCEVVTQTAEAEGHKMIIHQVGATMVEVFAEVDTDRSGMISQAEFDVMKDNEKVTEALALLSIQKSHLVALGDSMFGIGNESEGGYKEMSFTEFLEMAIHLRPENLATVLDVIEMRHVVTQYKRKLENKILDFEAFLATSDDNIIPNSGSPTSSTTNSKHETNCKHEYASLERARNEVVNEQRKLNVYDSEYHLLKRQVDECKRKIEMFELLSNQGRMAKTIHSAKAILHHSASAVFGPEHHDDHDGNVRGSQVVSGFVPTIGVHEEHGEFLPHGNYKVNIQQSDSRPNSAEGRFRTGHNSIEKKISLLGKSASTAGAHGVGGSGASTKATIQATNATNHGAGEVGTNQSRNIITETQSSKNLLNKPTAHSGEVMEDGESPGNKSVRSNVVSAFEQDHDA